MSQSAVVPVFRVHGSANQVKDALDGDEVTWGTTLEFAQTAENVTTVSVVVENTARYIDWGGAWESRFMTMLGDWERVLEMRDIRVVEYIDYWTGRGLRSYLV